MVIRDDVIWARHIAQDPVILQRIAKLAPGETIRLRVDGILGRWEKMQTGSNGVATQGLKPVGPMRNVWSTWQARRGETVEVEPADEDDHAYLDSLSHSMSEWMCAEDEAAYGKLRTL